MLTTQTMSTAPPAPLTSQHRNRKLAAAILKTTTRGQEPPWDAWVVVIYLQLVTIIDW